MRNIFQEISARESVRTSYYVRNIELGDYTYKEQYDAHECLI